MYVSLSVLKPDEKEMFKKSAIMVQFVFYMFMQRTGMKTNLGQVRTPVGSVHAHSNNRVTVHKEHKSEARNCI